MATPSIELTVRVIWVAVHQSSCFSLYNTLLKQLETDQTYSDLISIELRYDVNFNIIYT